MSGLGIKRIAFAVLFAGIMPTFHAMPAAAQTGTFIDRFSSECKKGMLYGGIAGALGGAVASKDKNRMENAVLGAAAGAAAGCLIMKGMNKSDEGRLTQLQSKAAATGKPQTASWTNAAGEVVSATATPSLVPAPTGLAPVKGKAPTCRSSTVTLSAADGTPYDLGGDTFCRSSKGSWSAYLPKTTG